MWQSILDELRHLCTETVVKAWMETLGPVAISDDSLILMAPNDFKREIIENRFIKEIFIMRSE